MVNVEYVLLVNMIIFWLFCGYMGVAILFYDCKIYDYKSFTANLFAKFLGMILVVGGVISLLEVLLLRGAYDREYE